MSDAEELALQQMLLETPFGEPGSGMVRYGAAMYLFVHGLIESDLLEAYRIASKLDCEDPLAVAKLRKARSRQEPGP